jgi:ubiquinone/menaquinone biosynthesis C-methylase UbiE
MRLTDQKQIVANGYDRVGGLYAEQAVQSRTEDRLRYESELVEGLPAGADVLDLGCGAGVPTTRRLAKHFKVTGVDISGHQIARARRSVPGACFIHGDMTQLDMPAGSFDSETNKRLIEKAGLGIISARVESYDGDGVPGRFLWLVARKPSLAST